MRPDLLPDVMALPEFKALPFSERQSVFEDGAAAAAEWVTQNGGWDKDTWKQWGQSVSGMRDELARSETFGEKAAHVGKQVAKVIPDTLKTIGAGAVGASPVLPDGSGGITGQIPFETTLPMLDANLKRLSQGVAGYALGGKEEIEGHLTEMRRQIDEGELPFDQSGLNAWLDGHQEKLYAAQERYAKLRAESGPAPDADKLARNTLLGRKENVAALQRYLNTRDPAAFEALRKNALTTPLEYDIDQERQRLSTETKLGRALTPEAQPFIQESADPAEIAGIAFTVGKGVKALGKAGKGAKALEIAKGALGEVLSEQVSTTMDDPNATWGERWQTAKDSLAASLGLAGAGAAIGKTLPSTGAAQSAPVAQPSALATIAQRGGTQDVTEGATDADFDTVDAAANVQPPDAPAPSQPVETPVAPVGTAGRRVQVNPALADLEISQAPVTEGDVVADFNLQRQPVPATTLPDPTGQTPETPQTITGSDVQTGPEMPVPPPSADADAGAGGAPPAGGATWEESAEFSTAEELAMAGDIEGAEAIETAWRAAQGSVVPALAGQEVTAPAPSQAASSLLRATNASPPATAQGRTRAELWADEVIEDGRGRVSAGLDPKLLTAYTIKGAGLVRDGLRDFAAWSREMLRRFSAAIKPHLQTIWAAVQDEARMMTTNKGSINPGGSTRAERTARARAAATMPNAPAAASQAKPLRPDLGGAAQDYTAWTAEDMRQRATALADAIGDVPELARLLSSEDGLREMGLGPDQATFVMAEALRRAQAAVQSATNDVDRIRATATLRQLRAAWDVTGTEAGQGLASRAHAAQDLRATAPALAVDEAVEKQQKTTLDPALPVDATTAAVDTAAKAAGKKATDQMGALMAQDSGALAKLINTLRQKIAPGMNWRDIFTSTASEQRAWELETYARIRKHQALQNLTPAEARALTREMSKAWQRERRTVFQRELQKQLEKVAKLKPAAAAKVRKAEPRLLQLINLGAFGADTFRDAIAQEWGIAGLNAPEARRLRALAEQMQAAPDGLPRRRLAQQFIEGLQDLSKLSKAELLDSYWTASVLSGWRTQTDILLGVMNGLEDTLFGGIVTAARSGNYAALPRALGAFLGNWPQALREAWQHLSKGDKAFLHKWDSELAGMLEHGGRLGGAARQLRRGGVIGKAAGGLVEVVARLLTALDHFNASSTREGMKVLAMARNPELFKQATRISAADRAAARVRARAELTAGVAPATEQERVHENARVKELLEAMVPTEILEQAESLGLDASLQGDVPGVVGGAMVELVKLAASLPRRALAKLESRGPVDRVTRTFLRALEVFGRTLTGTKFIRTVGHQVNRHVSYLPALGYLMRRSEQGMKDNPVKKDVLIAKQIVGTMLTLGIVAAFRNADEDDDDEQGIEGGWKGYTPEQRSQRYAQGKQPYSVWSRQPDGKVRSWNYNAWGIAGLLATAGAMEDQRRAKAHTKGDVPALMNGLAAGAMSWTDMAQLQGLQAIFDSSPYTTGNVADSIGGKLNRWAATTVGGLVPRFLKDIDAVTDPALYDSSQWWQRWTAQVPMVRALSGGKRVDIFGEEISLDRGPLSRVTQLGPLSPERASLGRLNERGLWLPDPSAGERVVSVGGKRREFTPLEADRYQRLVGAGYKEYIAKEAAALLQMEPKEAKERISKRAKLIRDRAARAAVK